VKNTTPKITQKVQFVKRGKGGKMVNTEKLVELMEKRGILATDLANQVGISNPMMSYITRGMKQPSVEVLVRIAGALKCKVDDLIKPV
jgi:DNA-binding Xre family transcriptional regulator